MKFRDVIFFMFGFMTQIEQGSTATKPVTKPVTKPCGNPECKSSSNIAEHLSFGSGVLDEYGFWEKPCWTCARDFEKANPEYYPCWPYSVRYLKRQGMFKCLSCGKPLKGPGAEHLGCALRHPGPSLKGWFFLLMGQPEKKVEEDVRSLSKRREA